MRLLIKRLTGIVLSVLFLAVLVTAVVCFFVSVEQNKSILLTSYTVSHAEIPAAFEGKRIVQVSDLHNKDYGEELTALVAAQEPDIIVITGDIISRKDKDITTAVRQAQALTTVAPVYYVTGNHEAFSSRRDDLLRALYDSGVTILNNCAIDWEIDGESVQLAGMFDPDFSAHLWRDFAPNVDEERYTILLLHRPDLFEDAAAFGADLVLSGHTHGGQIRLPLIGAVYAPNQGIFPKYDVGRFTSGDATMILCQGLGETYFMRILTPPELVVVTLDSPYR